MACFLVPTAEAVITKVAEKVVEKSEEKKIQAGEKVEEKSGAESSFHVPFSRKLKWLTYMLMGGAFLLAFEHIWHGEVQPFFPFLTAMSDKADMYEMFHEMATTGVAMAVLVTLVWGVMCVVTSAIEKRAVEKEATE